MKVRKGFLKKILGTFAAFAMTVGVVNGSTVPVHAASITISSGDTTGGTDNTKYTAYKILNATKGSGDAVSYTIETSDPWYSVLSNTEAQTWLTVTAPSTGGNTASVTLKDGVNSEATTAEHLAAYLKQNIPQGAAGIQLNTGAATNVDEGYYLVVSTLGSSLILATTDVTITEKNNYPSLTKTADKTNLQTGENVTYTITVNIPATATVNSSITVHDTLDSHLKFNNDLIAKSQNETVELSEGTKEQSDETFAKSFYITNAMLGHSVVLTYTAELLSTAEADTEYSNKAFLNYSDFKTVTKSTSVKTFDFNITKAFEGSTFHDENLQAKFQLRTNANDPSTAIEFENDSTGYVIKDSEATSTVKDFITVDDTKRNVRGLKAGTYYLVETETSAGYNKLNDAITVTVSDDGTVNFSNGTISATGDVEVTNQKGSTLPSTGGIGTTIFYIAGGILIIGAAVLLIARRKRNA